MYSKHALTGLLCLLFFLVFLETASARLVTVPVKPVGTRPPLPPGTPQPAPTYMVDNINNVHRAAPDKGSMNGPILHPLNESTFHRIHGDHVRFPSGSTTVSKAAQTASPKVAGRAVQETHTNSETARPVRRSGSYWLESLGSRGKSPLAPSGYQFFRNVMDFGATGDGSTDDTAAINRALAYYSSSDTTQRCGKDCGSTTTLGAVVYFPPGTYIVSTPLIMYYYTQMIGDPTDLPIIKGTLNFSGIALVDSDPYIPGGNGNEWYINQSNFYRSIRNFKFDLTSMNWTNYDNDQQYVPTGIHWQVGQATSITNCEFTMSVSTSSHSATGVGIFMENGSGGMVSDLTFTGGNIGFRAGSQQFTAVNLQFTSCLTAISMVWDWGFNWKNIYVLSCYIALDLTAYGGNPAQGTGSISVLDSHFNGVPYAITLNQQGPRPNIILDNLLVEDSASVILISGGETILQGSTNALYFNSWGMGLQYLNSDGEGGTTRSGFISPSPDKPASLLDSGSGRYFTQPRPLYESDTPIVATDHGVSNDNSGDQSSAINTLLAENVGSVIFFPAGIYLVESTVKIPVGSIIVGSGWSQIMAVGSNFEDESKPYVMVQVGESGDSGTIEISDFLFTVRGPLAGCILMEWNVHESSQGSAAMWDSHFRVGGAAGSDLQLADCPVGSSSVISSCKAATMMLHITSEASGYFENIWAWVADHDLDSDLNAEASEGQSGIPENVKTDISVYGARGMLIESQGPTWLIGSSSEHSVLYQYQLSNASTIYLGHMQTETPYYQPNPVATEPYSVGKFWDSDPTFSDCSADYCKEAWALRIISSKDIFIYAAGFYSFFQNNVIGCGDTEVCQLRLIDTNFVSGLWLYNVFTKGDVQILSPEGGLPAVIFNSTTQSGYTSELAAWLALSGDSGNVGNNGTLVGGSGGSGDVFIDPSIWEDSEPTVQCSPPCTLVLPPVTLSTTTTITFPLYTTSIEVGSSIITTITSTIFNVSTSISSGSTSTVLLTFTTTEVWSYFSSSTLTTVLTIPDYIGTTIPVWNVLVDSNVSTTVIYPFSSVHPPGFNITVTPPTQSGAPTTNNPTQTSQIDTRTIIIPPFPWTSSTGTRDPNLHSLTFEGGPPKPTCLSGCGSPCKIFCDQPCLLCPPGGGGGGGGGGFGSGWWDPQDPNDPSKEPGDDDENCDTSTYSSCRTICTATPSTCSSTCSNVIGCDTTGTDIASTVTTAPIYSISDEQWPTTTVDESIDIQAAQWAISYLNSLELLTGITSGPIQTAATTTTATTTKGSATTTSGYLYIMAFDYTNPDIGYVWQAFATEQGYETDFCDLGNIYQGGYGRSFTFDAFGYQNCNYTSAGETKVGTMSCPGAGYIPCYEYNVPEEDCDGVGDYIAGFECVIPINDRRDLVWSQSSALPMNLQATGLDPAEVKTLG